MSTVHYELDGQLVIAHFTAAVREAAKAADDDSDDFVGIIRYAEGVQVAALLKERDEHVKISVRTRNGVSAQNICVELGGGGHVAAAGANVPGTMAEVEAKLVAATARELERVRSSRSLQAAP